MRAAVLVFILVALFVMPTLCAADPSDGIDHNSNYVIVVITQEDHYYDNESVILFVYGSVTRGNMESDESLIVRCILQKTSFSGEYYDFKWFNKTIKGAEENSINIGKYEAGKYKLKVIGESLEENGQILTSDDVISIVPIRYQATQFEHAFIGRSEFYVRVTEHDKNVSVQRWVMYDTTSYCDKTYDNITEEYFPVPDDALIVTFRVIDEHQNRHAYSVAPKDIAPYDSHSFWDWLLFGLVDLFILIILILLYIFKTRRVRNG